VGLRVTEPLADVDEKSPGVTVMPVAPELVQLSVVLLPAVIAAGLAENDAMVGVAGCAMVGKACVQPASPAQATSSSASAPLASLRELRKHELNLRLPIERAGSMRSLSLGGSAYRPMVCLGTQVESRMRRARGEVRKLQ
jgi:hypothetical protein